MVVSSGSNSGTAAVADATDATAAIATPVTASATSAVTQHNTAPRWNVESLNEGVSASTLAQIREFARIQANRDVELTRLRDEVCYTWIIQHIRLSSYCSASRPLQCSASISFALCLKAD
jgi:hypothetical protein